MHYQDVQRDVAVEVTELVTLSGSEVRLVEVRNIEEVGRSHLGKESHGKLETHCRPQSGTRVFPAHCD